MEGNCNSMFMGLLSLICVWCVCVCLCVCFNYVPVGEIKSFWFSNFDFKDHAQFHGILRYRIINNIITVYSFYGH